MSASLQAPVTSVSGGNNLLSPTTEEKPIQDGIELHDLSETIIKDREETTSTSTEDEVLDVESMDSTLLKVDGKGCLGKIERAPLGLKLCGMSLCAVFGTAVLGILLLAQVAYTMSGADTNNKLIQATTKVETYISYLSNERAATLAYLNALNDPTQDTTALLQKLKQIQKQVDDYPEELMSVASSFGDAFSKSPLFAQVEAEITKLSRTRQKIIDESDYATTYEGYYSVIVMVTGLYERMFVRIGSSGGIGYAATMSLIECVNMIQLLGASILQNGFVEPEVNQGMAQLQGLYSNAITTFVSLFPDEAASSYLMLQSKYETAQNVVISYLAHMATVRSLNRTTLGPLYDSNDLSYFNGNVSIMQDVLTQIKTVCKNTQESEIQATYSSGVTMQVLVVVLFVVFFVLTLGSAFFFSRTIAGPWLRLNRIQEQTIRKFVPQPLLKLLNCKKISDVKLGISIERDITMMLININNFSAIAQSMKDKEIFKLMNRYLDTVGPIVRKHGGFIDKILANRTIALFSHPRHASRAAIAIHQMMNTFNAILKGEGETTGFQLCISIHSAHVAIGTLGEHERLEGAILSKHLEIMYRMNQLAENLKVRIAVTQESVSSKIPKRYIGNVRFAGETVEAYEVPIAEEGETPQEIKMREAFSNAATNLMNGKYEDAQIIFQAYLQENPSDYVASHHLLLTKRMLERVSKAQKEVLVTESLGDVFLQSALGTFCKQEHSSENFDLWQTIEDYKRSSELTSRQTIAEKISKDFLDPQGVNAVNINAEMQGKIMNKIRQGAFEPELFNELQREIEVVMNDTHKRFKTSPLFKQSFTKSTLYPRVLSIDQS